LFYNNAPLCAVHLSSKDYAVDERPTPFIVVNSQGSHVSIAHTSPGTLTFLNNEQDLVDYLQFFGAKKLARKEKPFSSPWNILTSTEDCRTFEWNIHFIRHKEMYEQITRSWLDWAAKSGKSFLGEKADAFIVPSFGSNQQSPIFTDVMQALVSSSSPPPPMDIEQIKLLSR